MVRPEASLSSASFDLHVLSTPPAFILSQDQTLVISFSVPDNVSYLFFTVALSDSRFFFRSSSKLRNWCLWNSFLNFQGWFVVLFSFQCSGQVSYRMLYFHAPTLKNSCSLNPVLWTLVLWTVKPVSFCLFCCFCDSQIILAYFFQSVKHFLKLFLFFYVLISDSYDRLAQLSTGVNIFFILFYKHIYRHFQKVILL